MARFNKDGYELVRILGELCYAIAPAGTKLQDAQHYAMRVLNLPRSAVAVREEEDEEEDCTPPPVPMEYGD